jgi:hypothetical protein
MGGRRLLVCCAGTWWMCEVCDKFDGPLASCREGGALPRRPVNVWLMGADWMTRSWANCWAVGGAMERPGGGPFLRDVCGVLMGRPKAPVVSPCRGVSSSGPGPLPPCFWRASMICLCRSLTSRLRWSCSRMVGSWVWKPGDRQARPTSMRFALPCPEGRAVRAPDEWTMLWFDERLRR